MSTVRESPPRNELPPLHRNRDFLLLWTGAGFTLLGTRITAIAYPLLILWSTGSAAAAGVVGAAALLPNLVVQLPAGALVDRWDRRRLMVWCDVGCLLATASVAVAVFFGHVWLVQLVVVAFIQSSLAIFYQLAERAGVRHLVPAEQLPAALAQNEARGRTAQLLGQPVGSVLFAVTRWLPFLSTALTHLASLTALLLIRKKFQERRDRPRRSLRVEVAEGIVWTWRQTFLRTVMGFIAISNIPFQGIALAVIVIVREDGGSPAVIGIITALAGVGGILGAMTGLWWLRRMSLRAIVIGGLVAWALVMPPVAFARDPILLGVLFAVSSYVGGLFNVAGGIYLVRITPDEMMGRAGAVVTLLGSGTNFIGALGAGLLLDAIGITDTVLALSVIMLGLVVLSLTSRSVRDAGSLEDRGMGRL
jgi:MFS family permease